MIRLMQGIAVGAALALLLVAVAAIQWNVVQLSPQDNANGVQGSAQLSQETLEGPTLQQELSRIRAGLPPTEGALEPMVNAAAELEMVPATARQPEPAAVPAQNRAAPATPLDAPEPGQSRADKVLAKLESQFEQESVDDAWSAQSGDHINGFFADAAGTTELSGSTLGDVKCHSSLCRVEVVHENEQAMHEFALRFPMQMAESLPRITYQTEQRNDGRLAMVMYLSR